MNTKAIIENLREELLQSKPGSSSIKLAYVVGFYEAVLLCLAEDTERNRNLLYKIAKNQHGKHSNAR